MSRMHYLVTGGAGFIGSNYVHRLLGRGERVAVYDNLSRRGAEANIAWLREQHGPHSFRLQVADVRDYDALAEAARGVDVVVHLAGQVAVTTSVADPRSDFEDNALGTFNALEAARHAGTDPIFLYASTNKVYGGMDAVAVEERETRYAYRDFPLGISETQPLDFLSPYGCCYSADTDILTDRGWKKFYELSPNDQVLTYNIERKVAEYQTPTKHFVHTYTGKMYVQNNRRLKTCVTPNHKMLVSWDRDHDELKKPRLLEAQQIEGKPMAYLLAGDYEGGEEAEYFILPEAKAGRHKHYFSACAIPMDDWLRFLGWYIAEGHCYENRKTGNCTVTLTTYDRTEEAVAVMQAVGLSPVIDQHHITAGSRQLYEYVKLLGKSHNKYIPQEIKRLGRKKLAVLLKSLLDGDGNERSKHGWRYTTVSQKLADDVQEIAIKCGMAASVSLDKEGYYRVYISTTRTAQCNLDQNRSEWVDYDGMVYCVEVPNSTVMVRQNGHAYFSGNSKGAGDQYVRDYARIYGLPTVVFRQSCLAGASLVQTPQGDIPICALHNPCKVWSLHNGVDMEMQDCTGPFSPPLDGRKLYHIETSRGHTIRATDNHRFYTPGGYLPLEEILYGGFVAVSPQAKYVQRPSPASFPDDIILDEETVQAALAKCQRQPEYNETVMAWLKAQGLLPLRYNHPYIYVIAQLVGYLTGDAHLYRHFKPSRGKVDIGIQVYALAEELEPIKEDFRLLDFTPGKTMASTSRSELLSGHIIEGTSYKFALYATAPFVFFEGLGVPVGRKADIPFEVPDWILRAPDGVQDAYLRGLFGAEMTAPSFYRCKCEPHAGEFQAPTFAQSKARSLEKNARRFRQQIMHLLTERGVETQPFEDDFRYRKRGEQSRCYQFRVLAAQDNLTRLARIGYAYNRKRNAQLYRIVEFMQTGLPYETYEQWLSTHTRGLGAPEFLWDHIVEKQEVPLQPVYDIAVSENHNFIANGFLVHNCIYGPRQMGVEDQGWVAWFIIAAVTGQPITIYGDGKQVRDVLFIDDLLDLYDRAVERIDVAAGQVYNVGGGPEHTMSVWAEFGPLLEQLLGRPIPVSYDDWRPGDQKVYVSDIRKAARELGWVPQVSVEEGVRRLYEWVVAHRTLFEG